MYGYEKIDFLGKDISNLNNSFFKHYLRIKSYNFMQKISRDRPLKRFLSMRATILQSAFFVIQSKTYNFLRKTVNKACFLGKILSF